MDNRDVYCPPATVPSPPLGLEALYSTCLKLYPNQPNPLQVTAVLKYWLGGPDPLDYISMYSYPGDVERNIPPHWHYISFGLSDLHGDGRVHEAASNDTPSGFGFELTFRLKRELQETAPPTWPAAVMQSLAKYVFQSENNLCVGDHVSWHCPLDNSESRIQHMLMTEDPQMETVQTPFGQVQFVQIVGVCAEELQAAQHWNGPGIINLLKNIHGAGGPLLVTDMRRGETIFEIDPQLQDAVDLGIKLEGSNLSGVSARCLWTKKLLKSSFLPTEQDVKPTENDERDSPQISERESEQIKTLLKKGLKYIKPGLPPIVSHSKLSSTFDESQSDLRKDSCNAVGIGEVGCLDPGELLQTQILEAVHLTFNLESGILLPLALRGRLLHGRHFTFKSVIGGIAITFVPPSVTGSFVNTEHPYAAHGPWLQVLLTEENIEEMLEAFRIFSNLDEASFPKTFTWPERGLRISILPEE